MADLRERPDEEIINRFKNQLEHDKVTLDTIINKDPRLNKKRSVKNGILYR